MQINRIYFKSNTFPKLKISLLADIHDRPCRDVVDSLKEERPDIIAIAGDLTNHCLSPDSRALAILKRLAEISNVFYCAGNHEGLFGSRDKQLVHEAGAVLLNNEYLKYKGVYIGGLRSGFDGKNRHHNPPPETGWLDEFETLPGGKVLISHHPEYYEKYLKERNIDLILSGHAHGGQIRLGRYGLFSPAQGFFPKYTKGIYDNKLIVSAGLSNTTVIPRINNPRELVIIYTGS